MGKRVIKETIKEYSEQGSLTREQITETTEDYTEIQYSPYLYSYTSTGNTKEKPVNYNKPKRTCDGLEY